MPNILDKTVITTFTKEQFDLFKSLGVIINNEYFHLPQYFKCLGAGEFEIITFKDLPEDVKMFSPQYDHLQEAEDFIELCDVMMAPTEGDENGYRAGNVYAAIRIAAGFFED